MIKTMIFSMFILLSATANCCDTTDNHRQLAEKRYDAAGKYQGKTDSNGKSYDRQGRYLGKINADGKRYDRQGKYIGKVKKR